MADNIQKFQESTRPLGKLPTRLIVSTDTAAADLYLDRGILGRTKIAEGSASGNTWTVNDNFVTEYNNANSTKLTKTQLQGVFQKEYQSTLNKDRADIINKHSKYNTKTYLATEAKIPGVIDPETGKAGAVIAPTVAPSPGTNPNTGVGATPSSTGTTTLLDLKKAVGDSSTTRNTYRNDLRYPLNRSEEQDYIRFDMLKYDPRSLSESSLTDLQGGVDAFLGKEVLGKRDSKRTSIGSASLPISSPISDTNSVSWTDDEANAIVLKGQTKALQLMGVSSGNNPQTQPPTNNGPQGSSQTGALAGMALAGAAVGGSAGNLLTRTTGGIVNPNIELLFKGPSLRTFSFTFPLLARSEKESKVILQIIRFFKQGMSVKKSDGALFLKSPHTFRIKYISAKEKDNHPWINLIKECALTNCSVNYTPAGNYATYDNGAMTMYEITLNFSELEPIFDDDYKDLGNNDGNDANKDTMIGY